MLSRNRVLAVILVALVAAGAWAAGAARATTVVPEPQGTVILEVGGKVTAVQGTATGGPMVVRFDRATLSRLPQGVLKTYTDWTEGPQTFEGVYLKDLLAYVGARGQVIRAVALNDYAATIPIADASRYPVLLALTHNGQPMRVRDKGPIWIIYPYDDPSQTKAGPHNEKMVWQLRRLEIR